MKYSIIGCGFIYPRHKESIEKIGGEVILTCDIDPKKEADFLDYKEMFKSPKFKEVDVVVICTPNYLHAQMSRDAIDLGKKVLCEKPLTIDKDFSGLEDVNVVLQLRYHDMIGAIKDALRDSNNIELVMRVCRDDKWWKSWRGNYGQSGGILLGIAIHMFDFLIFLLGNEYQIIDSKHSIKKCFGTIEFPDAQVNYNVEILDFDDKEHQTRKFIINGKEFELCNKDNLSFAGYHDQVHKEFAAGRGITLDEARKSIELVLKL